MSPRAAARLESLGFTQVYDYVAGKVDWAAAGLPLEGANGSPTRAGAHVHTGVPVCRLDDPLHDVCDRLEDSGWDTWIRGRENVSAEEAMTLGPSTIRPSARLIDMVERMRQQNLTNLPVTTSDGRFVGLLTRRDAEEALREPET